MFLRIQPVLSEMDFERGQSQYTAKLGIGIKYLESEVSSTLSYNSE